MVSAYGDEERRIYDNIKIPVPAEWIETVRTSNLDAYTEETNDIMRDFEKFVSPLTPFINSTDLPDAYFINPIFADIDEEPGEEMICLLGSYFDYPVLAVFKRTNTQWYLIYMERFYVHNEKPELYIANNFSRNKTFYIRVIHGRGSELYYDGYNFYKISGGKVHRSLELLNRAFMSGWGVPLNQNTKTSFYFNSIGSDSLWVSYDYHFFPGPVFKEDAPWDSHPELSFIKGVKGIDYVWNDASKKYIPNYYGAKGELNDEKIASFTAFGDDELFVKAFQYEIEQALEKGTDEDKAVLGWYLEQVKNETAGEP